MAELAQFTPMPMSLTGIPAEQPVRSIGEDVKPFQPIDEVSATQKAYTLANAIGEKQDMDLERQDRSVITDYMKSGGNMQTPDGIQKTVTDLQGKLSPKGYQDLVKLASTSVGLTDKLNDYYAKMPEQALELRSKKFDTVLKAMDGPIQAYEKAASAKGSQGALEEFNSAKMATLQDLGKLKDPRGQPVFTPDDLKQFQEMTPEQLKSLLETTKFHNDRIQEAAKLKKTEAETARDLAQAEELRAKASGGGGDATAFMREAATLYGKDTPEYKRAIAAHVARMDSPTKVMMGGSGEGKAPAGYRMTKDGNLEFIPGGPADPATKEGKLGNREQVMLGRVMTSANETAKALGNIVQLPVSSDTGIFSKGGSQTSIMGAGAKALGNTMSNQEVQSYNVLSSGLQRGLASIEASGLAPSGSLTHQMDSVILQPGDTQLTKLQKLAEIRQIVEAGLETQLANPRVPEQERKHMQDVMDSVMRSVPFTQTDILKLQDLQKSNPNATLQDVMNLNKEKLKKSESATAKEVKVGGKSHQRPANFTDEQWAAYQAYAAKHQ